METNGPGNGWAGSSYAPTTMMFAGGNYNGGNSTYDPSDQGGQWVTCSKYTVGNIPDGTSETVGIVERLGDCPYYGWGNAWAYPMDNSHWGYNSNGSAFGPWGVYLPLINPPINNWVGNQQPAHPYYPTTKHTASCQTALMDGSVRGVTIQVSALTWSYACQPDDGNPLGTDW